MGEIISLNDFKNREKQIESIKKIGEIISIDFSRKKDDVTIEDLEWFNQFK
ncbi:hypothetical protein HY745_14555, partial [Candidatus Desantisbacteria bacterium]|nr:hypothetical protein [Candidatus Desantisbacteria bacterium]